MPGVRLGSRSAAGLVAMALALACASTLERTEYPKLRESPPEMHRLAIAPFEPEAGLEADAERRRTAAAHMAAYVAEAMQARGVRIVPPSDVRLALQSGDRAPGFDAVRAARASAAEFGADALLAGRVLRFRKRTGEALGTLQPASVAFEVTLYTAPGGERLWSARFDETQEALFANVLNLFRYPRGGTRWLTAEELARWGAREVAAAVPGVVAGDTP